MFSEEAPSKRIIKLIGTLDNAKGRRRAELFVAEGTKCVLDLAASFAPRYLFATEEWYGQHAVEFDEAVCYVCAPGMMRALTRLTNTPPVIAAFNLPVFPTILPDSSRNLVLALDGLQDPGNLGTIIRTADWMGIKTIVASKETVDAFNPKTVQATMGALARVRVVYTNLSQWLKSLKTPIYGTFLDGENIYRMNLSENGVIVMGNEGHGISDEVAEAVNRRIFIPSFPPDAPTSESLNVATATAITLSEFRSRFFSNHG